VLGLLLGLVPGLLSLSVLLTASPARAQAPSPEEEARQHFERGTTAYNLGRFEDAIADYRRAYEVKGDPAFLFNIAQAYHQLGVDDQALFFYKRYLASHPEPPNRAEVQARITALEPRVAARASLPPEERPPPATLLPPRAPHEDVGLLRPGARPETNAPTRPAPLSLFGRPWFWAALVGLAATGFVTAALLSTRRAETEIPSSDLGNARFF
jgi:tetratricopeptide (TPR) repeat protein